MSKNLNIKIPSAQFYDIPWESKNEFDIEKYRSETVTLETPKKANAHLWLINLSHFNHSFYWGSLSNDERDKLNRLIPPIERERRAKSRIILRLILAEYLNVPSSEITFSYCKNGKPSLNKPLAKLSFNLSHSADNLVVLIGSHRSIGVDIESETRLKPVGTQLAKRFFHQQELKLLQEVEGKDQSILFNKIWTLKEAILKSTGSGVFFIEKTPDFSSILQEKKTSTLQFYKTKGYVGFTFYTKDYRLSAASKKHTNKQLTG